MTTVSEILRRKGPGVVTIDPDASVLDAARLMNTHRIGAVVVATGVDRSNVVGILTERDVLTRVVAEERDPRTTKVSDVMTSPVIDCTPQADLNALRATMRQRRIRHMPVREGDTLCGMVSIGDLNALQAESLSVTVQALEEYITRP
jgi:CBS domain-containing protein